MERYSGLSVILKYLFLQYVSLSNKAALIALFIGISAIIAGLVMLFFHPTKKHIRILLVIAILPLFIGIAGAISTIHTTQKAAQLEQIKGIEPSAQKYFDLQYGYSKALLHSFSTIVGAASAIPGLLLVAILKRKNRPKISRQENRLRR